LPFCKPPFACRRRQTYCQKITANAEHSLEKYRPPIFDDFVKVDDRTIQRVLREVDWQILAIALKDAKKEVKDIFLRNMSKRAAGMIEEDIEYLSSPTESDIENTRQLNEYYGGMIIRDAIKKCSSRTILQAFKGIDKQYRTLIMQYLPTKTTDEITEIIAKSDKEYIDFCSLSESRKAQQQIINAINKGAKNLSKGEVLKD